MLIAVDISDIGSDIVSFLDSLGRYPCNRTLESLFKVANDFIDYNEMEDHVVVDTLELYPEEIDMLKDEMERFSHQIRDLVLDVGYSLIRIVNVKVTSVTNNNFRINTLLNCDLILD